MGNRMDRLLQDMKEMELPACAERRRQRQGIQASDMIMDKFLADSRKIAESCRCQQGDASAEVSPENESNRTG